MPFRTAFPRTDAALVLVAVVVAVAALGHRSAGVIAALSATVWFDFFLIRPWGRCPSPAPRRAGRPLCCSSSVSPSRNWRSAPSTSGIRRRRRTAASSCCMTPVRPSAPPSTRSGPPRSWRRWRWTGSPTSPSIWRCASWPGPARTIRCSPWAGRPGWPCPGRGPVVRPAGGRGSNPICRPAPTGRRWSPTPPGRCWTTACAR
ncbi:DUF4118 domain-containing protein [Streptomyces sp. NPDC007983]|uniref:DUF4118 domain-containing protein n=1 Tax=Streptomyces sp. NPDC007983 TaxID=3364800 RepID=UPI0036ED63C6